MTGDLAFFLADVVGFAIASVIAVPLMLVPGALVARGIARLVPKTDWRAFAPALSIAVLPLAIALIVRAASPEAAVAASVALVAAAALFARGFIPRPSAVALGGMALLWLFLLALYADVDIGGGLYQSITVLDLVKHAAVVREIAGHGLPLNDPFFARPDAAGYYHYFYDLAAVIDVAGGRLVDPRIAFCGAAFACGIAFASFLRALVVDLGWQTASDRRLTALVVGVCTIGGLDLIGIAFRYLVFGILERTPEWWDEEISFFPTTASWVPHHLAGVLACFVALFLLAKCLDAPRRSVAVLASLAGAAMGSAFGLSIWVTLGGAAVIALTLRFVGQAERPRWLAAAAIAGGVALVLSVPQFVDLAQGRAVSGSPIGIWIREPARMGELFNHPLNPVLWLMLTPIVWGIEFGAFALGSWLFWRSRDTVIKEQPFARVMIAAAVGGLLLNLMVRSTLINNDFGWRVAWFAGLPAMVFTIAVLQRPLKPGVARVAMAACIGAGIASTGYALVIGRASPTRLPPSTMTYINADPSRDLALREAYAWANANLPGNAMLQHNPAAARRAFAFGLYSDHRVAVADGDAELFGASAEAVDARTARFGEIFARQRPLSDARGVHLVVTDRDPLWRALTPRDCLYRAPHVCITRKTRP